MSADGYRKRSKALKSTLGQLFSTFASTLAKIA
jgi:hypothetical protein